VLNINVTPRNCSLLSDKETITPGVSWFGQAWLWWFKFKLKHGRPQTFFQGRAKFSGGLGQKNILFDKKKLLKHTIFFQKSRKTNYFGLDKGASAPLALLCGRP
jgi:hypothetical protein